jgi:hypothetical protein
MKIYGFGIAKKTLYKVSEPIPTVKNDFHLELLVSYLTAIEEFPLDETPPHN